METGDNIEPTVWAILFILDRTALFCFQNIKNTSPLVGKKENFYEENRNHHG